MKKPELLWLAGILEGEGSFLAGPPSNRNGPRITIEMTDREILSRVSYLLDIGYVVIKPRKANYSESYRITKKGKKAVEFMKLLYPYMGQRRQGQITRALKNYKPR